MLLYPHRISPFLLLVPVIAFVQYVFTLGMALLVSAINVFFRDLGNVLRHVLRLWFYLSPALYSMAILDASATFQQNPLLRTLAHANPFAVLFEAYRAVIYGKPDGAARTPRTGSPCSCSSSPASCWSPSATIVFKRLEPTYAKVL